MNKAQGGFSLIGILDGTTVNGLLRVEGTPLIQRYNKGTTSYIPDFELLADNVKPTLALILRNTSDGSLLNPTTLTWSYNGVALTFDANGLCTNATMAGMLKKIDAHQTTVGSESVTVHALRVLKNLVPISGEDNDRISVSGTVEVGGTAIPFNDLAKDVIIQETTGNQYDIVLTNTKGSQLLTSTDSLVQTANIYKNGILLTDTTGFTFKWYKVLGTGDEAWGTAKTQTVTTSDVDNKLIVKCAVFENNTLVGNGFDEVTDFSDPIIADCRLSGVTGEGIRKGQTAIITPYAYQRASGSEVSTPNNWDWSIRDNNGAAFILTGKDAATFSAKTVSVTFEDVQRASMGMRGSFSYNF